MKTLPAILLSLCSYAAVNAQAVPDMTIQQDYFYGTDGNTVHKYSMSAGSVSDQGPCTGSCAVGNLYGLAYGNDILNNSTNRTLYASTFVGAQGSILRWSGSAWDVLYTDSFYYLNGGAYGSYIYFIQYDFTSFPNTQAIVRLQSDGTIQKIYEDNSLVFTVADLAVDEQGNIYCFRGTGIGNTTQMNVISPAGVVLSTYATTLNYEMGFYGSMFIDGTLYLGQDIGTPALIPVTYSGSTLSMGLPVFNNFTITDLANGHGIVNNTTFVADVSQENNITAIMHGNYLQVNATGEQNNITTTVFDASGKLLISQQITSAETQIDMQQLHNGLYFVRVDDGKKTLLSKRVMKAS